ncbi:MAG: sugar phosphate isomerase/epimerase [Sediminibacterium magnilacihabitans]|jgi:sugar phosphate isomerase/epimerase|nr:sugar phosphate isomerase/epimerase [Sediminibacterium magnilacihabitans]PQV60723.1 sugar phosphate isomerase/epimerase [Sediminibacterium magnilacihabitans]
MKSFSRRNFLKTGLAVLPVPFAATAFGNAIKKHKPLLAFSTLGCPDWTYSQILDFAQLNGYNGIEIRGIQRQIDLGKCPEFSTPEKIAASLQQATDKGLRFVDLGSSAELHHANVETRQKNIAAAKQFIDLAQQLNCPYVRVFPNSLPKDDQRKATIDRIISGLLELGNYAQGKNVKVLLESHGDAVKTNELKMIMDASKHPHVGMVWDVANMWTKEKESPASVYAQLKDYIFHTHLKDFKYVNGKEHYVLLGQGEVPIFEAIDALYKGGYKGYYSFEWEKLWHPDIDAPEVALADFPKAIHKHFGSVL